jgi:fucose permease
MFPSDETFLRYGTLVMLLFVGTDVDRASWFSRIAQEIQRARQRASPIIASFSSRVVAN